jgi:hypothetical protein
MQKKNADGLVQFIRQIFDWLLGLFQPGSQGGGGNPPLPGPNPEPVQRKVALIVFDPPVPAENGQPISTVMGWGYPDALAEAFISEIETASHGYVHYQVVERRVSTNFPIKEDGFRYTANTYIHMIRSGAPSHTPDTVNYNVILQELNLVPEVNSGQIDEVWWFGFPYSGFYESRMVGPGAFWCNGPAMPDMEASERCFVIMGFSYERGVGEMLESMSHRVESIMERVFVGTSAEANLWGRFTRYDQRAPGRAEVGTVHYAPNSQKDYDWGNSRPVLSLCRVWEHYPDLRGNRVMVDCREWGNGDIRQHHRWWLNHLPCQSGQAYGISHNWWQYVIDPGLVR